MEKLKRFIYNYGYAGATLSIAAVLEKAKVTPEHKRVIYDIVNELADALKQFADEEMRQVKSEEEECGGAIAENNKPYKGGLDDKNSNL